MAHALVRAVSRLFSTPIHVPEVSGTGDLVACHSVEVPQSIDEDKQHVVELLDRLEPSQVAAVVQLLEVMIREDDDKLTEQDRPAVAASLEYFRKGGEGIPFEQVVADLGLTVNQLNNNRRKF